MTTTAHPGIDERALLELRGEVRDFIADQLSRGTFTPRPDAWLTAWSADFSRAMAERGWVGMTLPPEYGGAGRSFLERFVVTEEVLVAGAPVAAHWVSDRQAGPSLLRFGSEELKRELLPRIAAGRCFFAIGMSEPDAGSDLASVRTKATACDDGWVLSGTKVWTTGAHRADHMIVLARTSGRHGDRHQGLSQFIVALDALGIRVSPIVSMNGDHHFNEVLLDDVHVPSGRLLGTEGEGWRQVTSELAFERSGPERFLSVALLVSHLLAAVRRGALSPTAELGRLVARLQALHHMSFAVARTLDAGSPADVPAAMVKTLGTTTEGDLVELAALLTACSTRHDDDLDAALRIATAQLPGFTLRGGTNEILRGIITKGLQP
ncbi:acyl-CoA dehydrogenase family protein [Nocardioides carbamazepini]|uniref:acyl-CoA dehydrogenase family protein n=1 Tax=Nocardioides carbamazepini TaxID=2854259 RepID=UPI00214A046E|nr:acyl-CoA dehydrogenase family protein [Nocardioides carbamazepini]MCR1783785.1 acyl-CoA dehydrogenase family protein [Nocardioides carbamazepini]